MSKEHHYAVIRGPAITEKGTLISEKNQILFNVPLTGKNSSVGLRTTW